MIKFLALKSFRNRKFISSLCVLSIALSLALFLVTEKMRLGVEDGFTGAISDADLVVGARAGSLQLVLYSIFNMGSPTNNISMETYNKIKNNPAVAWTIPISLGDSYKRHRVVATDENFLKYYRFFGDGKIEMAAGKWPTGIFDVTLGSMVANKLKHKLGDSIVLSHGIRDKTLLEHDKTPFRIVGVLKTTGTPVDKSVYITLQGMEALHVGWENGVPNFGDVDLSNLTSKDLETEQITSFILRTKNRMALLGLQRYIATFPGEALSAVIPAIALAELWGLLDQVKIAFLGVSAFVIAIGLLTILISLYMSLNERRHEMAVLRSVGVPAGSIFGLFLVEASLLSVMGAVLGIAIQYIVLFAIGPILESYYSLRIPVVGPSLWEPIVIAIYVVLGSLFGLVPALKAYKMTEVRGLVR